MDADKRKRKYYSINHNYQKKRRQYTLEPGIKGFFCTCNFHEKDCVREAKNILTEYADNLYGSEQVRIYKTIFVLPPVEGELNCIPPWADAVVLITVYISIYSFRVFRIETISRSR